MLRTRRQMVGIVDSDTNVKLQQISFFRDFLGVFDMGKSRFEIELILESSNWISASEIRKEYAVKNWKNITENWQERHS